MKELIKTIIAAIVTITAGFFAMALPFRLLTELTVPQMRILFISELLIFFAIFFAVSLKKENKAQRKEKERRLRENHNRRVEKQCNELAGIALI